MNPAPGATDPVIDLSGPVPTRCSVLAGAPSPLTPHVTAVLVSQDGEDYLSRTVAAVRAQTRPADLLVAVDAGSRDGSLTELTARAGLGPRVFSLPRRAPLGDAVRAALTGLAAARLSQQPAPRPLPGSGTASTAPGSEPDARSGPDARSEPDARSGPDAGSGTDAGSGPSAEGGVEPRASWVWLLHDDGAPAPGALQALLEAVEIAPSVAIAGCKQVAWDDDQRLLEVGFTTSRAGTRLTGLDRFEVDQGQHDDRSDMLAVGTAGMLIRRDVWDELGGPDPALRGPGSDLDLCRRARLAGHRVIVVPSAVVAHARATASGARVGVRAAARADRADVLFLRLAAARRLGLLPVLLWSALTVAGRAGWRLLTGRPARALDEVLAGLVLLRPVRWLRARRRAARTRRVPVRVLRPLLAGRRQVWRYRRDGLASWAGRSPARPPDASRPISARSSGSSRAAAGALTGAAGVAGTAVPGSGPVPASPPLAEAPAGSWSVPAARTGAADRSGGPERTEGPGGSRPEGVSASIGASSAIAASSLIGSSVPVGLGGPRAGMGGSGPGGPVLGRSGFGDPLGADEDDLLPEPRRVPGRAPEIVPGPRRRGSARAVLLAPLPVVLIASVAALAALRGRVTGAGSLVGPYLLPSPDGLAALWRLAGTGWRPVGLGAAGVADPFDTVLAVLSVPFGGSPGTVVTLLLLGGLPLAALSAWIAAGMLTGTRALRVWAALAWAAAPPLLISVGTGRPASVLAHVLLPLAALALARAVGVARVRPPHHPARPGRPARSGRPGSPGRPGRSGRPEPAGQPERTGQPGRPGRPAPPGRGSGRPGPLISAAGTAAQHASSSALVGTADQGSGWAGSAPTQATQVTSAGPAVGIGARMRAAARLRSRAGLRVAALAGLLLTGVLAAAPSLAVPLAVALLAVLLVAPVRRFVPLIAAVPALLLLPWWLAVSHDHRLLLADPGLPRTAAPAPARPDVWWHLLLLPGNPRDLLGGLAERLSRLSGGMGGAGLLLAVTAVLVAAPVLVLGLTGLLRRGRAGTTGAAAWLVALAGLGIALLADRVDVAGTVGGPSRGWSGPGLSVLALGAGIAALIGMEGWADRLRHSIPGFGHLAAGLVAVIALCGPAAALAGWAWQGWTGAPGAPQLTRAAPDVLPAAAAVDVAGPAATRTLILRVGHGRVTWALARASGPRLGDDSAALAATRLTGTNPDQDVVAPVLGTLLSGSGADVRAQLADLDVGSVLLLTPLDDATALALDVAPGLSRVAATSAGVLWRVELDGGSGGPSRAARVRVVDRDGHTEAVVASAGTGVDATLAPGPSGRLLVLSERRDAGWRATLDGRPLEARSYGGWAQAFALPMAGGRLQVGFTAGWASRLDPVRAGAGVILLLLLVPVPRWRRRIAVAPPRPSRPVPRTVVLPPAGRPQQPPQVFDADHPDHAADPLWLDPDGPLQSAASRPSTARPPTSEIPASGLPASGLPASGLSANLPPAQRPPRGRPAGEPASPSEGASPTGSGGER